MIISVHIRKAGGSSFRQALKNYYGKKLLLDYGDEIGSNFESSKKKRLISKQKIIKNKQNIIENYNIIHGHFFAQKYEEILGKQLAYVTFLRDPVERVLSNYFYLKRNPKRKNPDAQLIHKMGYSLQEYIQHPDACNVQSQFLNEKKLNEFKFVGVVEQYHQSIILYNKIFNTKLEIKSLKNVNPNKNYDYQISKHTHDLIVQNNQKDIKLYSEALKILNTKCKTYEY